MQIIVYCKFRSLVVDAMVYIITIHRVSIISSKFCSAVSASLSRPFLKLQKVSLDLDTLKLGYGTFRNSIYEGCYFV